MPFMWAYNKTIFTLVQVCTPPREWTVCQYVASSDGQELHIAITIGTSVVCNKWTFASPNSFLIFSIHHFWSFEKNKELWASNQVIGLTYCITIIIKCAYTSKRGRSDIITTTNVYSHRVILFEKRFQFQILLCIEWTKS